VIPNNILYLAKGLLKLSLMNSSEKEAIKIMKKKRIFNCPIPKTKTPIKKKTGVVKWIL